LSALEDHERVSGLSLSQIETFLALVEEGSMARASRRLGVGRSTLSAHIKSLGEEFNQRLFVRVRGGLAITPAGSEAYRLLRPLMMLWLVRSRRRRLAGGRFRRSATGLAG
jgi:DNA-binding transcriptional LysR family regulator